MRLTINGGIGDLIHSHAMVEGVRHQHDRIEIGIDRRGVAEARSPEYLHFADRLLGTLCDGPPYALVDGDGGGQTPQMLAAAGLPILMPDLRRKLGLLGGTSGRYVAVTTKIRGWDRAKYLAIREEFLAIVWRITMTMPVVLIGEREIGRNAEYEYHGPDRIFSIYEDLAGPNVVDQTVPELGCTPPTWRQFLSDCRVMAGAERVLTLGTGGNVSMAMASGRAFVLAGETEMGDYFLSMPPDSRVTVFERPEAYLEAAGGIA